MIAASLYKAQDIRAAVAKAGPGWNNLHPEVKRRALQVIADAAQEFASDGLKVGVYEGWRTPGEQGARMAAGASWVNSPLDSYHPWGLAVDFVFIDKLGRWTWLPDPKNPSNRGYVDPKWKRLGAIIERAGFQWGGRFRNYDGPHAQLVVRRTAELKTAFAQPLDYIATFA